MANKAVSFYARRQKRHKLQSVQSLRSNIGKVNSINEIAGNFKVNLSNAVISVNGSRYEIRNQDNSIVASGLVKPPLHGSEVKTKRLGGKNPKIVNVQFDRMSVGGICFAVGPDRRSYGFRLDRLVNYSGESLQDIGLVNGAELSLVIENGEVTSAIPN